MSLKIEKKASDLDTLVLIGRLDTVTAPELEAELEKILPNTNRLYSTWKNWSTYPQQD